MSVNSNDQNVSAAVKAVAQSMDVSEAEALKVLVAKGAEEMAKSLNAQAFAQGNSVHLGQSQGHKLLGHELTHTIQQSTRTIQAAAEREKVTSASLRG